jgi:hypothetical protein
MIYDWKIVVRKNIYGFHEAEKFMQLRLLSPDRQVSISAHLSGFSLDGSPLCVFEGHIPFIMQFLSKLNLTGCGQLRLSKFSRLPATETRYETEIHCSIDDIIVDPADAKLLSHPGMI